MSNLYRETGPPIDDWPGEKEARIKSNPLVDLIDKHKKILTEKTNIEIATNDNDDDCRQ